MDIDLKKLRQLVTVAKTGNFSRAAEELHITQPALSRSIASFEAYFGIRIFDRGRSGASLTPLGALAITEAEKLLDQARSLGHNLQLYGKGDGGKIAIGMGPLIASMVLPNLSRHFIAQRPQLSIQAVVKSANILYSELANDQIERLYVSRELVQQAEEFAVEELGTIKLSTIIRTDHPLSNRKSVSALEASAFPLLSGDSLGASQDGQGTFVCDNYHILRETVMYTDSIWITSPQFVAEEIANGTMQNLSIEGDRRPYQTTVCEVRKKARSPSPAGQAIGEFVRQYFAELPP